MKHEGQNHGADGEGYDGQCQVPHPSGKPRHPVTGSLPALLNSGTAQQRHRQCDEGNNDTEHRAQLVQQVEGVLTPAERREQSAQRQCREDQSPADDQPICPRWPLDHVISVPPFVTDRGTPR